MKLDPSSQGTGMTKKGGYSDDRRRYWDDTVIKEPVSATCMTPLKEMNQNRFE
ncbi:hypothetical protein [Wolbachia endosymbiont (group A) of Agelastica alni]|uniref:hypothetical protein n=1 Tax=Wolbachia endosymbiont (group A) of Agelastica alni TaxID=3066130 RepID=UPI003132D12D